MTQPNPRLSSLFELEYPQSVGVYDSYPQAQAAVKVLIQTSALPESAKKEFREASKPPEPNPAEEEAKRIALEGEAAKVEETKSKAMLNMAKAQEAGQPEMGVAPQQETEELPMEVQIAQAVSEILERNASAKQKNAAALKTTVEASLAPAKHEHEAQLASASFEQGIRDREADREMAARRPANA